MDSQIITFRQKLKKTLAPSRYEHSLSVSYTCMCLAMRFGYNMDQAEMAGILHDCAKRFDEKTLIEKCQKQGLDITDDEYRAPAVLHAKYGAWMAKNKYGIDDDEILDAIACHTTGKANMKTLDKILYIADYIEPRRFQADNLAQVRKLAFEDLDETMRVILSSTLQYLKVKGAAIDQMTQEAADYFEALPKH